MAVSACDGYWNPPERERSDWLCERVLPAVRRFLDDHREHGVVYTDDPTACNEEALSQGWSEIDI